MVWPSGEKLETMSARLKRSLHIYDASVTIFTTEANSMIGGLLQIAPSNLYQILYFFWIISRNPITNSKRQYEKMHLTDRSNKRPHQPWPRQFRHLSKICRNQWHEELRSEHLNSENSGIGTYRNASKPCFRGFDSLRPLHSINPRISKNVHRSFQAVENKQIFLLTRSKDIHRNPLQATTF